MTAEPNSRVRLSSPMRKTCWCHSGERLQCSCERADGSLPLHVVSVEMLSDGSMPEGIESVGIRPKHPKGGLPLTDDMAYMAVTAMLRDAVGLPLNRAADRYKAWLNRVRRNAIEKWVDSLPERESTRLHVKYLDRDGAGHPKEEEDA